MANHEHSRPAEVSSTTVSITTTSNDSTPTTSSAQQLSRNIDYWAQIRPHLDLMPKWVPTAWSVFLFVGGLASLRYFWLIGFMPELDVNSSVTLLAASAITGGVLFLLLSIGLLIPCWVWIYMIPTDSTLKRLWSTKDGKAQPFRALAWLGFPICFVLISTFTGFLLNSSFQVFRQPC
jgi:hypothetical protein